MFVIIYLLLKDVLVVLMIDGFVEMFVIIDCDLWCDFGFVMLCIFVMGLNLYVGENGYFGCEEIDVILLVLVCVYV